MILVFDSVSRIIDCLEKTSIEELKKVEDYFKNNDITSSEKEVYAKVLMLFGSFQYYIKSEKEIINNYKNLIEKFQYLQRIYFEDLKKTAATYFTNSFKWFITEAKWDTVQAELYRKKFLNAELQAISTTLDSGIKSNSLDHFIKIIGEYTVNLIKNNATPEMLSSSIDELYATYQIFGDKSDKELKRFYNEHEKQFPNYSYKDFITLIETSKQFKDQEKNKEYKDFEKFKKGIDTTRSDRIGLKGKMLNINYNKIKIVEAGLINQMFADIKPTDTIYIALIHALNNYKIILEKEKKKKFDPLQGMPEVIQVPKLDINGFVAYLITKDCFDKEDNDDLISLFEGTEMDKKINFRKNINILASIFYDLKEMEIIKNEKIFIFPWILLHFTVKNKKIKSTYFYKLFYRKTNSGRIKENSTDYIDIRKFR